jgi:hypothetical protein
MTDSPDRYAGQPLLKLLECYVLDAIGELDVARESSLRAMAPKLAEIYAVPSTPAAPADWRQVIAAAMQFPPDLAQAIRDVWIKNLATAKAAGRRLSADEFARLFVDENFRA